MKKFIVILALALLSVGSAFSQAEYTGPALYYANEAQLFKTFTNYITTSDDSTGFISFNIDPVLRSRILLAREVRVIAVATDTVRHRARPRVAALDRLFGEVRVARLNTPD